MVKRKNPYKILGVHETSTDAEIKKQYRRLAGEHHPDKNNGKAASAARTTEINIAYDELRDPEKRAAVDTWLRQERAKRKAARAAKTTPRRAEPPPRSTARPNSVVKDPVPAKKTPRRAEPPPRSTARPNSIVRAPVSRVPVQRPGAGLGTILATAFATAATAYVGIRIIDGFSKHYDPSVDRYRGRNGRFRR